jgi:hypothetical protein
LRRLVLCSSNINSFFFCFSERILVWLLIYKGVVRWRNG